MNIIQSFNEYPLLSSCRLYLLFQCGWAMAIDYIGIEREPLPEQLTLFG